VSWTLLLDLGLAAMLAVTIFYAVLLNRRLAHLRSDRSELEKVAGGIEGTLTRAEQSVGGMKVSTEALTERLARAETLSDDLRFLIERGESLADALEERVRSARPTVAAPATKPQPTVRTSAPTRSGTANPRSEAERELMMALAAGR
jgi:hypothetical protein